MAIHHTIIQGDTVSSLAKLYGFAPDTIWNDPANQQLREARKDMDILLPGDVIVVPELRTKTVVAATGTRHVFRRVGVPMPFRVQVQTADGPVKQRPYLLEVGDLQFRGETTDEGWLDHYIPNNSTTGTLTVEADRPLRFTLRFGEMDPITTVTGVQKRLNNLSFPCGPADGTLNAQTVDAIRRFQTANDLQPSGEIDDALRAKLAERHDTLAPGMRR